MKVRFTIKYWTAWGESLTLEIANKKYPMTWGDGGLWSVTVDNCSSAMLKDYGYLVMRGGLIWRTEWTRHSAEKLCKNIEDSWIDCPIPGCPFPRKHSAEMFDQPGFRAAGTAIPVFSLRSSEDFGIGEFSDLHYLIDWAVETGQSVIQLLPVNDTTRKGGWQDSYPYSPVSSFALNPMYIHLQGLGIKETESFRKTQAELNSLPEVDYPRVFKAKMALVREAFEKSKAKDLKSRAYKKFVQDNSDWLLEYSDFCAHRDSLESEYYHWMQWQLDKQFSLEADYARSRGIALKGDLPIGVSADSAEAYWHPELFNLDSTAGAPPDYFSADGQNWGFPTYNWDAMAHNDYAWWKSRLRKMSRYFDAFRIDHILGFFRIWEIPVGIHSGMAGHFNPALPYSPDEISALGLPIAGIFHEDPHHTGYYQPLITPDTSKLSEGQKQTFGRLYDDFFYHRHNEFWRQSAERKLPELLSATGMLACGEDLGMIPACVPEVMEHEKILSLRMRGFGGDGEWPVMSVCGTSSHDSDTLRMQCPSDPEPWEVRRMLWEYLSSPSMLSIFPLQDWLALSSELRRPERSEERINYPANPHNKWKFRIHLDLSKMKEAHRLNAEITGLLKDSARYR